MSETTENDQPWWADGFGLKVRRPGDPLEISAGDDDWALYLPHRCDEWVFEASPDRALVLAAARRLRGELDAAIAELETPRP